MNAHTHKNKDIRKVIDAMADSRWGEERILTVVEFIEERARHYSEKLGFSFEEVVKAWEDNRNYSAANYYQDANFQKIEDSVLVVGSEEEFKEYCDGQGFVCGHCGENTKSPYECESCHWKSYGLLGPGETATFVVMKPAMRGQWIFRPTVMET